MEKKFLLFDFDGVISNTFEIAYDIMSNLDDSIKHEDQYRKYFEGNIYESIRDKSNNKKSAPTLEDPFFSKYAPRLYQKSIDPGIKKIIIELAEKYHLTIMSSTVTSIIEHFLENEKIRSCFGKIYGPEISLYKYERIEEFFVHENTSAKKCLFITDTLGDIREARKADVDSIAVNWGYHLSETLEQGNPVAIVNTPQELLQEIDKYFL